MFSKTAFGFFCLGHLARSLGPRLSDNGVLTHSCAGVAEKATVRPLGHSAVKFIWQLYQLQCSRDLAEM